MTADTSPDWLPAGWTLQFKFQKTGRKITHYVNLATGQKFFTKDDLIRYTRTGGIQCDDQLPTSRQIKMPSANDHVNTVVKANERPEWLPKNWLVEVKAHKSGANIGKNYKIYVDPSTGFRFRSKPEVFRFLNHGEQKNSKPKRKKRASHSTRKVVIKKSTVDDLPVGWIKEVKIKRNANGVRRDPYYTDPASGYVFRSKKAVLRYLETGEIGRDVFVPKKHSDDQTLTNGDESQLPAAKRQKLKHPATRRQLFTGEETSDRNILSDQEAENFGKGQNKKDYAETGLATASVLQIPERNGSVENAIKKNPETAEKSSWSSSVAPKASKRKQGKIVSADNVLVSTAAANVLQVKNLLESGTEKRSSINSKNSGKSKNKKELDLPHEFSNRLARLEPEQVASGLELVKPCQNEATGPCVLEDEAPLQLNVRSNTEVAKQASAYSTVKSHWGLVKNTIKPIEDEDVLGKQPQMLETEKTSNTKSEVQPFFCSDPCLEFTIKTLRGAIPREGAANEGLVSAPASNVLQENNLGKTRMESKRSNIETKKSNKFKKMKELDLPRRSSKQLVGLEPELVANGVSTEVALQNATIKSGKKEPKLPCVLVDKTTRQLNVGPNAKLPNQASVTAVNPEINNIRPHEDRAILGERPRMLGTQKGSDSKSELQPFFCSDPCLEFAIKTLTGAIPLEDAINEGLVSTPIANIQQQKNLAETRIEHSSCRKTLFNSIRSKKKGGSLHHQSSKRLAGHKPELVANSLSNEQVLNIAARKSYNSKAIQNADLTSANLTEKASQQLEIRPRMTLEHRDFTYRTTLFHVESSNKSKEPHENQTVPTEMNNENPGLQSAVPFGNSWSDPCFESAFKTVTGSSPAEDSFAFQNYFQQQFGSFGTQRDGNFPLPDYNVFQSDISSHLDATAQPVMQQKFPLNPPFLPPGNVSLPSCSKIGAQQPYRKGKRNYQAS